SPASPVVNPEVPEVPAAFESTLAPVSAEEHIRSLWTALQVAEKRTEKCGLQFGQAMYEYREKYAQKGFKVGCLSETSGSFEALCKRLNIPRATAYRWINRYEESIGERPAAP